MIAIDTRAEVVREAREWVGTPYRFGACMKGIGADCATLLLGVYRNCGIIQSDGMHDQVSQDWWCHTTDERYLYRALRHACKTIQSVCYPSTKIEPGNPVLTRAAGSRVFNHGGIVLKWPRIVHAVLEGVCEVDATQDELWSFHEITVLDPWVKS